MLCQKCHDKVDVGLIQIYGYQDTSKGRVLDYKIVDNIKKKSKFDIDQVKIIKNIGSKKSIKVAKIELLEKHNLKVSDTIIRKILSDKY